MMKIDKILGDLSRAMIQSFDRDIGRTSEKNHPLAMERRFEAKYKKSEAYAKYLQSVESQRERSNKDLEVRSTTSKRVALPKVPTQEEVKRNPQANLDKRAQDMRDHDLQKKRAREAAHPGRTEVVNKNRQRAEQLRNKYYTKPYLNARAKDGANPLSADPSKIYNKNALSNLSGEDRSKILESKTKILKARREEGRAKTNPSLDQWRNNLYKSNPNPVSPGNLLRGVKVKPQSPLNLEKTTFTPSPNDWWGSAKKVADKADKKPNMLDKALNVLFGSSMTREDELKATFSGSEYTEGVKGFTPDMKGVNNLTNKELETYKNMIRSEAAKGVRTRHANVDPFLNSGVNRQDQKLQSIRDNINYNGGVKRLEERLNARRAELRAKAATYEGGNYNSFTNEGTKEHWNKAQEHQKTGHRVNGDAFTAEGSEERGKLYEEHKKKNLKPHDPVELEKIEKELAYLDRKQEQLYRASSGTFGGNDPTRLTSYEHAKSYAPQEGISGYGLGASNYMKASRTELAVRALHFANPVGAASREVLQNAFGVMTSRQAAHLKLLTAPNRSYFARFLNSGVQAQLGVVGGILGTALTDGNAGDLVTNLISGTAGPQGWRIGSSVAGAMVKGTPTRGEIGKNLHIAGDNLKKIKGLTTSSVLRGTAGVVGGLTGFAVGMLAVQKSYDILQDLGSNRSKIRKVATDLGKRQQYMALDDNFKTLTAKQAALNKLAKSGLNDRAMLLGNEARVMKGLM